MDRHGDDKEQTQAERVAERRRLLNEKLKARKNIGGEETAKAEDHEATGTGRKGEEAVRAQRKRLATLKAKATEAITRFRVITDSHEGERRIKAELQAEARMDKIREDASMTKKSQSQIGNAFEDLAAGVGTGVGAGGGGVGLGGGVAKEKREYKASQPQELHKALMQQQVECNAAIETKNKLIAALRAQMREKEEEYVSSLKQQADDIDRLIAVMHEQTEELVNAYDSALEDIERAYVEERRELIEMNAAEIDEHVKRRGKRQDEISAKREAIVAKDQEKLTEEFERNAEAYNQLKMSTMQDIHELEQKYESIQAQFYLNSEKLTYNLQVLRERKAENEKASNLHRKKLGRLQDVLSTLIAKYNDSDKKFRQTNKELTEGYRRVTSQYKDLQRKFQHFEQADAEKFRQVWGMHEQDCMKLVHQCLQGDRVVFEELLGVKWQAPSLDFWLTCGSEEAAAEAHEEEAEAAEEAIEAGELGEHVCSIIYAQMPFLVDETFQRRINAVASEADALALKVEAVLAALCIKSNAELRSMIDYFVTTTDDGEEAIVNPQEVAAKLQMFLNDRKAKSAVAAASTGLDLTKMEKVDPKASTKRSAVELEVQKRQQERDFWQRMADVVPDAHRRLWRSLEGATDKYIKQLQKRQGLINETDAIRKQNDELRSLLNQYLGSKINEELFSPPQLQVASSVPPKM